MARIVYAHAVIPPGERKNGVAAPAKARSSGPGAPVTAQRRRASRAMPKTGPKAPLVTRTMVEGAVIDPITVMFPAWLIRWGEVYPSQNVLMRKYANHHAYAGLIAKWEGIFRAAMLAGKIPRATCRRRLTITRFVRSEKYRLDRGNLVGGGKPFLDAAVRAGLIRNDREEDVDDIYRQAIDDDERVEITVSDL